MTHLELLHDEPVKGTLSGIPSAARRVKAWWLAHRDRFSVLFAVSLTAHAALFIFLIIAQSTSLARKAEPPSSNEQAIRQALAELAKSGHAAAGSSVGASVPVKISESEAILAFEKLVDFDARLGDNDRVEIIKRMIRSFLELQAGRGGTFVDLSAFSLDEIQDLLKEGKTIRLSSGEKAFADERISANQSLEFYKLDREDEFQIRRLRRFEGEMAEGVLRSDEYVTISAGAEGRSGIQFIPHEYYFRECPYERILARGPSLFMVVRGFPSFGTRTPAEPGGGAPGEAHEVADRMSRVPEARELTLFIVRKMPSSSTTADSSKARLSLSAEEASRLFDRLMVLPDNEQLAAFEREFLDRYEADDEGLARLAAEFVFTNLNSVFFLVDDFSLAFDGLEELFYKHSIYDFYPEFWRRHPASKTAAEFLFCLAGSYDFERRVLAHLERTAEEASAVLGNRVAKPGVFNPKAKAYVLLKMRDALTSSLQERGLHSIEAAIARYVSEEAAIYGMLAGLGGDVRNRALFARGRLEWEEGRVIPAFETWRRIEASFDHPAFLKIQPVLQRSDSAIAEAVAMITQALAEEAGPDSRQMLARQHRFHKWKNRERLLR